MEYVARGELRTMGVSGNSEKNNNVLPLGYVKVPRPLEGFYLDADRRSYNQGVEGRIFHREAGVSGVEECCDH